METYSFNQQHHKMIQQADQQTWHLKYLPLSSPHMWGCFFHLWSPVGVAYKSVVILSWWSSWCYLPNLGSHRKKQESTPRPLLTTFCGLWLRWACGCLKYINLLVTPIWVCDWRFACAPSENQKMDPWGAESTMSLMRLHIKRENRLLCVESCCPHKQPLRAQRVIPYLPLQVMLNPNVWN